MSAKCQKRTKWPKRGRADLATISHSACQSASSTGDQVLEPRLHTLIQVKDYCLIKVLPVLKYPILVGRTIPQVEYCFLALSSMQAFDPVD
jgi:hypothetical protein